MLGRLAEKDLWDPQEIGTGSQKSQLHVLCCTPGDEIGELDLEIRREGVSLPV